MVSKRVLVVISEGFEELETVAPVDLLRRAGAEVVIAGHQSASSVKGKNGIEVRPDQSLQEIDVADFDALLLPGGPHIKHLRQDSRIAQLIRKHYDRQRLTAAICAGPLLLHDAGVLKSHRYTSHFSTEDELTARDKRAEVVDDFPVVTSQGAGTATAFGLALVEKLYGLELREKVAADICYLH